MFVFSNTPFNNEQFEEDSIEFSNVWMKMPFLNVVAATNICSFKKKKKKSFLMKFSGARLIFFQTPLYICCSAELANAKKSPLVYIF